MRQLIIAVALFCGGFVTGQLTAYGPDLTGTDANKAPQVLRASPADARLGDLLQGDVRQVMFRLENLTSQRHRISGIFSSCDCAAATPSSLDIDPNGHLDLSVAFNAHALGPFAKTIRVQLENGSSVSLLLTGTVSEAVSVDPKTVAFGLVPRGLDVHQQVQLTPKNPDQVLRPSLVSVDNPAVEVTDIRPLDSPKGAWQLQVTAHPRKVGRPLGATLILRIAPPPAPWVTVQTTGMVSSP